MEKIISGKNIVKTFGKGAEKNNALDGVDIEIPKGEFVAVMGPSGCGKSTLLFTLSGTDSITSGSVCFDGMELSELSENTLADIRRKKMGFVFQQPTMLKNLNLLDNIILPSLQDNKKTGEIIKKVKALMKKTGIAELGERNITEVSGGQLQRAGICRALMSTPEILFADEPTGALNSKSAEEIMELLSGINESGTAILLVTHDAKVAARADRVLFMKDGEIKSELSSGKFIGKDLENRTKKVVAQMRNIDI
ncbi:MAG: ABC transporter ATP-binding protein [Lachnospiraceae bacterium]